MNKDLESISETYKDLRGECPVAGLGVGSGQEVSAKGPGMGIAWHALGSS